MRRGGRQALAAAALIAALAAAVAARAQPPSGIVQPPGRAGVSPLQLGAGLYAANCAGCHGIGGSGVPVANNRGAGAAVVQGPPLVGVGALAPDFYLRTGRMPLSRAGEEPERQRPFFGNREIEALIAYVASFGGGPPIPHPNPRGASLSKGLRLYTEHCAGCHQAVGQGGYVTGARVPVLSHATARQIAEAVRIGPFLMPRFSPRSIDSHQLDAIVAYVLSTRSPLDAGGFGLGHIGPVPEGIVAWLVAAVVLVGICMLVGRRLET